MAFSVPDAVRTPPSRRNMFAELAREYQDAFARQRNSLLRWARQGALLLNTSLTVEAHKPASHAKRGWEAITDAILTPVLTEPRPQVFLLRPAARRVGQACVSTCRSRWSA